MATESWATKLRHDSDAEYVAWRDELVAKLTSVGLGVAETNITVGAGTRAAIATEAHYAVFYLDDSLHATAPVYFRFGFGTGSASSRARIQVTVGTATNGSGVISGFGSSIRTINAFSSDQTSDTTRQSIMCFVDGFFGLSWKSASGGQGSFFFCRSCDTDGDPTATGAVIRYGDGSVNGLTWTVSVRYAATAAAYSGSAALVAGALGLAPAGFTDSNATPDTQAFLGFMGTPLVSPIFGMCGVFTGEISTYGTFTTTLVGSASRTFIVCPNDAGPFGPIATTTVGGLNIAMLWE